MPPASGKSYVIALLCAMVCEGKQGLVDKIVISFPNEVLHKKDSKLYEAMQQVFEGRITICVVDTQAVVESQATEKSLVIVDEADY